MIKLLTLEEMTKFNNEICGNLVRFAVSRGFPDHSIPLTEENLQDMFVNQCDVTSLAKVFNLSFTVRKNASGLYTCGSIWGFYNGISVLYIRTGWLKELKAGEDLLAFRIGSDSDDFFSGSWSRGFNSYQVNIPRNKIHFTPSEIKQVKKISKKYNLNVKGPFSALKTTHCNKCHQELK